MLCQRIHLISMRMVHYKNVLLPFDWTLRCWVCVCCFVLLYFGCYVMLCVKKIKNVDNKKKRMFWNSKCNGLQKWNSVICNHKLFNFGCNLGKNTTLCIFMAVVSIWYVLGNYYKKVQIAFFTKHQFMTKKGDRKQQTQVECTKLHSDWLMPAGY